MNEQIEKKLNLSDLTDISNISESYSHAGKDYIFSHIVLEAGRSVREITPVRFDGMTFVAVLSGEVELIISGKPYIMGKRALTIMGSNDVISANSTRGERTDAYALFLSSELLSSLTFDVSVINPRYLIDHDPVMELSENEMDLLERYFKLLHHCAVNNNNAPQQLSLISRSIGRSIVVALLYQLAFITENRHLMQSMPKDNSQIPGKSRKVNYVHEFMKLLHEYYRKERTVSFYANKLCISPKYLSLLVKEVTGRTAADIIDQFVINEAKNMLRFSGYTIQQVAYKLNFPNQSAFGKYFKHITGSSPTTFRSN